MALLVAVALASCGGSGHKQLSASSHGASPTTARAPTESGIQHVVLVMLENTGYTQIIANSSAPYINNTLLSSSGVNAGLATNYHAGGSQCQHPSQPNYMEITSGNQSPSGCGDSLNVAGANTDNIFHQLPGGQSWSYVEGMSSHCSTAGSDSYQDYHNIELAYADAASDCKSYDVPFSGASLPANAFSAKFTLFLPDCPDQGSHDCGANVSNADSFLSKFIPAAMNTAAYKAGNTAILVTWDEDEGSEGSHVPMIEIRPGADRFRDDTNYQNHASTLAGIEKWAGVPLLGDAQTATPLGSDFGLGS
jgi:phosphatidylinositol-3-phosphatase